MSSEYKPVHLDGQPLSKSVKMSEKLHTSFEHAPKVKVLQKRLSISNHSLPNQLKLAKTSQSFEASAYAQNRLISRNFVQQTLSSETSITQGDRVTEFDLVNAISK